MRIYKKKMLLGVHTSDTAETGGLSEHSNGYITTKQRVLVSLFCSVN